MNPLAETTNWVYDVLGRVTTMTHANGTLAQHDYDAAGRLTALRNLSQIRRGGKSDLSVLSVFTYSYDSVGTRTGVAEASGDLVTWSYDEAYQLTREQRSGANGYDVTYTYDGVGNRLTQEDDGELTTYSYDAANELTVFQDNSGLTSFSYDANGNTTLQLTPAGARTTYSWDSENRLTQTALPAGVVNTFTLDGDGRRRSIGDSAGLRLIVWDEENLLAETDSGGTTQARYTLAPEVYGTLVSQRRSGATSFHHFDALGSTSKLTDSSASQLVEYLYRAFGQQSVLSGSSANPFTWVGSLGYYRQSDSQDYWVRARVMMPTTGRWISRDPVHSDADLYAYVRNSPLVAVDPSGLARTECIMSAAERGEVAQRIAFLTNEYGKPYPVDPNFATDCFRMDNKDRPGDPVITIVSTVLDADPCLRYCAIAHEELHARQCWNFGVTWWESTGQWSGEPLAWRIELKCLGWLGSLKNGTVLNYNDPYQPSAHWRPETSVTSAKQFMP